MNEPALSPKRARYLHRLRQESRRVRLWQAAFFVGFFAFWELSCRVGLSDGFLVSSPSRVAATFLTLCRGGDVLVHVGVSCWETVVGFLLGTAAGTVVAVATLAMKLCCYWRKHKPTNQVLAGKFTQVLSPLISSSTAQKNKRKNGSLKWPQANMSLPLP